MLTFLAVLAFAFILTQAINASNKKKSKPSRTPQRPRRTATPFPPANASMFAPGEIPVFQPVGAQASSAPPPPPPPPQTPDEPPPTEWTDLAMSVANAQPTDPSDLSDPVAPVDDIDVAVELSVEVEPPVAPTQASGPRRRETSAAISSTALATTLVTPYQPSSLTSSLSTSL